LNIGEMLYISVHKSVGNYANVDANKVNL